MTSKLTRSICAVGVAAVALAAPLAAPTAHATLAGLTETAALANATAVPGSTVRATGTFTATADLGNLRVAVNLLSTNGAGSFTIVSTSAGLSNCSVDGTGRGVGCDFIGANVGLGTQQIVVDINVAAGATVGGVWDFQTGSGLLGQAGSLTANSQQLTIVAPSTTTVAPTTTAAPTTAVATTAPATAAPTTAVGGAGGGLPSVGFGGQTALIAALFVAIGGVAIGASRRRVTR